MPKFVFGIGQLRQLEGGTYQGSQEGIYLNSGRSDEGQIYQQSERHWVVAQCLGDAWSQEFPVRDKLVK